ncbi:polyprenyl synthetase family protein [Pontibacillus sp. HMF3514]|uniref:polyprenyl synthetase family protein n=1 Tax=Pontibacillus sp. HMF3514 TaxID=2692425 RepID=UPI001F1C1B44|nr:farnesyl diphosphate synthase [Pontibacillus sp. HMF3514]
MTNTLTDYISGYMDTINQQLEQFVYSLQVPERLRDSMLYSIQAGGKRIRPILLLMACEAYGGSPNRALPVGCAVEMVHTYSLIHDDLPAMDNDDIRRGMPTNHKKFDDATAILAGDGLLTASFFAITNHDLLQDEEKVYLSRELSKASGAEGMVAGQMLDMEAENQELTVAKLEEIHKHKTGELLRFSAVAGAYVGGANQSQLQSIEKYARHLGLLFQVQDDILDVIGDEEEMGKPVGSDENNSKSTYPQLLGLQGAIDKRDYYASQAKEALKEAGVDSTLLEEFIDYIQHRKK